MKIWNCQKVSQLGRAELFQLNTLNKLHTVFFKDKDKAQNHIIDKTNADVADNLQHISLPEMKKILTNDVFTVNEKNFLKNYVENPNYVRVVNLHTPQTNAASLFSKTEISEPDLNLEIVDKIIDALNDGARFKQVMKREPATLLIEAALRGDVEIIKLLLDRKDFGLQKAGPVLIKSAGSLLNEALLTAARQGSLESVLLLLENGADVNAKYDRGTTALMSAIPHNLNLAKLLVRKGADVHVKDKYTNYTPLLSAVEARNVEAIHFLLDNDVDINASSSNGVTPLMFAVFFGEEKLVKLLLDRGADANKKNTAGDTALDLALAKPSYSIEKNVIPLLEAKTSYWNRHRKAIPESLKNWKLFFSK